MRLKINYKFFFIILILLLFISGFGNSMTTSSSNGNPMMFIYELRLIDLRTELYKAFGVGELNSGDGNIDIGFVDYNLLEVNLPGIMGSFDIESNENVFKWDFRPKIMTTPGRPAFVSIIKEVVSANVSNIFPESFLFAVNPVDYSPETGFITEVIVSKTGLASMDISTEIKHVEDQWLPVAVLSIEDNYNSSSFLSVKKSVAERYAVVYMKATVVTTSYSSNEIEDEKDSFVWMDFEGLENLFSKEQKEIARRSSFARGEVRFEDSFSEYLFGFEGQIYFPDVVFVNPQITLDSTYNISQVQTDLGMLLVDSFAVFADFEYIPMNNSGEKFSFGIGFDDITNPAKDTYMKAGFIPVKIYPGKEEGDKVKYPLEWYLSVFSDKNKGWNYAFSVEGDPELLSFSAEFGYRFEYIEILGGVKFSFENNSLEPFVSVVAYF